VGTTWGPHALHVSRRPARRLAEHTALAPPLTRTDAYSHVLGVKCASAGVGRRGRCFADRGRVGGAALMCLSLFSLSRPARPATAYGIRWCWRLFDRRSPPRRRSGAR
jgi:hypothetical protein